MDPTIAQMSDAQVAAELERIRASGLYKPSTPVRPAWPRADRLQAIRDSLRATYRIAPRDPHPDADLSGQFGFVEAARACLELALGRPADPAGDGFGHVVNALATADFPEAVRDVTTAMATSRRSAILPDILAVTHRVELQDYREAGFATVDIGELPAPSAATTGSYFTIKPRATAEKIRLHSLFARLLVSRQAVVNGDTYFLPAAMGSFAHAAHRSEMKQLATLLEANANLEDGTALFDAARGNLAVATLDAAGLAVIMATLREQPSESGLAACAKTHALVIHPDDEAYLLVLMNALQLTAQPRPAVIVNPFLASNASWYALADPASFPAVGRMVMQGSDQSAITVGGITAARERAPDGTITEYPGIAIELSHTVGLGILSPVGLAKFSKT